MTRSTIQAGAALLDVIIGTRSDGTVARIRPPFYDEEIVPATVSHEYLSASRTARWWPRKSAWH